MNRSCTKLTMRVFIYLVLSSAYVAAFSTFSLTKWEHQLSRRSISLFSAPENPVSELTSALARIDQQWKIQQKLQRKPRWRNLILPKDDNSIEESPDITVSMDQDYCYLLEPPGNTVPSCVIVFMGGAGLGTYPQIAYNEFLLRVSDRLNAAVITVPYQLGIDHFAIAKQTGDIIRRAILFCQDDPSYLYPENLPIFSLSHSLGSKLSCIYAAATKQSFDGIGYISFNNFSFGATIGMAKTFLDLMRNDTDVDFQGSGMSGDTINTLFRFAEMAISAVGVDFSPSKEEMDRLVRLKYNDKQRRMTRLFSFDDDVLESTKDFIDACDGIPSVSGLPGTHLTPVYFKLGVDDLDLPSDMKDTIFDTIGGFRSISFGNDEALDDLVSEVCSWIVGKEPTRLPNWMEDVPRLAAN